MRLAVILTVAVLFNVGVGVGAYALRRRLERGAERDRLEEHSSALGWRDVWRVQRAVGRGRAVGDPALASAAVARARYVQEFGRRVAGSRWRWLLVAAGLLQLAFAVVRLVEPGLDSVSRVIAVLPPVVGATVALAVPWLNRFYGRRARRAEQLNQQLVDDAGGPSVRGDSPTGVLEESPAAPHGEARPGAGPWRAGTA